MVRVVIAHYSAGIHVWVFISEIYHEPIHLSAIHLIHNTVMAVIGTLVELRIGEQKGKVVVPLVPILLATAQPIDVGPLLPILIIFLAEITEHMVEGAVLHHEHHNLVNVCQRATVQCRLWMLGQWFELSGRYNVA
jgi:hypothetical protein